MRIWILLGVVISAPQYVLAKCVSLELYSRDGQYDSCKITYKGATVVKENIAKGKCAEYCETLKSLSKLDAEQEESITPTYKLLRKGNIRYFSDSTFVT